MSTMQITDHVFVVTGASSGIGDAQYFVNEYLRKLAGA
jgi:NADP-dependent 3-hydroxy acid dehydrogenase YdfG